MVYKPNPNKRRLQLFCKPELVAESKIEAKRLGYPSYSRYVEHCIEKDLLAVKDTERLEKIIELLETLIIQLK